MQLNAMTLVKNQVALEMMCDIGCVFFSRGKAAQREGTLGEGEAKLGRRSFAENAEAIAHVRAAEVG